MGHGWTFNTPSGVGLLVIIVFEHNVLDGVESGLTTLSGGKGLLLLGRESGVLRAQQCPLGCRELVCK